MNDIQQKVCPRCGNKMYFYLRKLVYMNNITINDVPVNRCSYCDHHELKDDIKDDLKRLLRELDNKNDKEVSFTDYINIDLDIYIKNSDLDIDSILDIYLLAKSLNDKRWMNEMKILFDGKF